MWVWKRFWFPGRNWRDCRFRCFRYRLCFHGRSYSVCRFLSERSFCGNRIYFWCLFLLVYIWLLVCVIFLSRRRKSISTSVRLLLTFDGFLFCLWWCRGFWLLCTLRQLFLIGRRFLLLCCSSCPQRLKLHLSRM